MGCGFAVILEAFYVVLAFLNLKAEDHHFVGFSKGYKTFLESILQECSTISILNVLGIEPRNS